MPTAVVILGGPWSPGDEMRQYLASVPRDVVIAADSGLDVAHEADIDVDWCIGDLDSVSSEGLARFEQGGGKVRRAPVDKTSTDAELALGLALEIGCQTVVCIGTMRGDVDHCLAQFGALVAAHGEGASVAALFDDAHIEVVRDRWCCEVPEGETVSVLAWGGSALVSLSGFHWNLDHHELAAMCGTGLRNRSLGACRVQVHRGVVLVIRPHVLSTSITSGDSL